MNPLAADKIKSEEQRQKMDHLIGVKSIKPWNISG
jgi:hypothetical protein